MIQQRWYCWGELATAAGISAMQAYRIRDSIDPARPANPTLQTLDKIAMALGVKVRDIIDEEED